MCDIILALEEEIFKREGKEEKKKRRIRKSLLL
jgi:hypothetical protein